MNTQANLANDLIIEWVEPYIPHLAKLLLMIIGGAIVSYWEVGHFLTFDATVVILLGYGVLRLVVWGVLRIELRIKELGIKNEEPS